MDYESFIAKRVTTLRQAKGVSARDMSLSIGQNVNYINHVENRKMLPSMQVFFFICEYLNIAPTDFFDESNPHPEEITALIANVKKLDHKALSHVSGLVEALTVWR
ncbi:MAG: helix-turn-helix domain-containing protein [Oscillospiraceae bacterium]|jgi:transcriptional regulator with XRE-family HTH domain|nr:helix-turn-helix domain-containing protein [Oscillospiraceae bacterium]